MIKPTLTYRNQRGAKVKMIFNPSTYRLERILVDGRKVVHDYGNSYLHLMRMRIGGRGFTCKVTHEEDIWD